MGYRILNFVDGMELAQFLDKYGIDWLFLDDSLSTKEVVHLLLEYLDNDTFSRMILGVIGKESIQSPSDMIQTFVDTLIKSRVVDLIKFYRKQIVSN